MLTIEQLLQQKATSSERKLNIILTITGGLLATVILKVFFHIA